jgi:3-hydroxybutyryl-CoA dehydrogenase
MAHGRVFIAGPPDDPSTAWLRDRLREVGYWPQIPSPGRTAIYGSAAAALPVMAGLDLWRTMTEERKELLASLDAQMHPGIPLISLCTAVHVDEVAAQVKQPSRVLGISMFEQPREGMLVELLPGTATATDVARRGALMLGSLGFQTETLPAGSWAVYPRIISMIVNEAAFAIGDGVASAESIDMAMRLGANYPQGPLALADSIGIDRILEVLEALQRDFGDDRYRPAPLLRRLARAGWHGKDAGRGFHSYAEIPAPKRR